MHSSNDRCDLCGLPLPKRFPAIYDTETPLRFCCMGCRMVYTMLSEAADAPHPSRFRETDLYKECLAAGIIPATVEDLAQLRTKESAPLETRPLPDGDVSGIESDAGSECDAANWSLPLNLEVSGMWCPACAWVIETMAGKIPGVSDAACNFATDRFRCRYDPVTASPERIITVIEKIGYPARSAESGQRAGWRRPEFIRLMISIFFTANVMMLSFSLYSGFFTDLDRQGVRSISWPIFLMAAVVFFYGGRPIFRKAWSGFRSGSPGMEALIAVGAASAFFYSITNFLQAGLHLYFDTAAMLITLVLLGKMLEQKAKEAVQTDLEAFFSLRPKKVRIVSDRFPNGRYVSAEQLRKGDRFRVAPHEVVPADGVVLSGRGTADASAVSGEARAVGMKPGNRIKSGARLIDGRLTIRADRVGADSLLGQMIETMQRALDQKAEREGKTDRILRIFVPGMVILALVTAAVVTMRTGDIQAALIRGVTVLVIACPCALGIAIPLARVVGISLAVKQGILIRRFSAFEVAGKVDLFVMDKTGTLTSGRWSLMHLARAPDWTEEKILSLAAGLEADSDHYIAVELRRQAVQREISPALFDSTQAHENGLCGIVSAHTVKIGSAAFLKTEIKHSPPMDVSQWSNGDTPVSNVYMSIDERLVAVFGFGDRFKTRASSAVAALLAGGFRMVLVSGDEKKTVTRVAGDLKIPEAHGEMLPAQKGALVSQLRRSGAVTAMVGDGINDAPALAAADLSIALYSGYPLGKETADVTLMRGDPGQIPEFLDFAGRVERKIQQNLWASFAYNLISIPIAMSGLLSPLVAVAAMLLSSLSVTGNILLFMRKERKPKPLKR